VVEVILADGQIVRAPGIALLAMALATKWLLPLFA
jgi:hypothetical protein